MTGGRPRGHEGWGICPGCDCERRVTPDGAMAYHRRWDAQQQQMVPCEGRGLPAIPAAGDLAEQGAAS